ncbi:sedoheptulokinase-like [Schistocerca gregaria]|uniref:sedoheptulokinase-like n=1 Tax=Schistocerca gregaria TaxID=7010 RepID=UPI00211F1E6C|nr:sedoheptulokinase-like [Schistocerca gregaria]XP_049858513.1 sedoheptulokinase-like [Schistocerca gregaria]XP_049858514.1 sedoheptulokinase-like [Schistocerca gregaria]
MSEVKRKLVLGIDIGTTSIKVCIVDAATKQTLSKQAKDTQANVPSDQGSEGNKQNVPKIISALNFCISRLPKDQLKDVEHIGICGQMHGVMLWTSQEGEKAWEQTEVFTGCRYEANAKAVSALYTWQDSRCDPQFLATLPKPQSHLHVYSGYGCATLFWIARNRPDKLDRYNCAGTVQDFAVAMLCDMDKPVMSVQNAAMWGYFDTNTSEWNTDILHNAGFPTHILPRIVKSGEVAGSLANSWYGIPSGTPVGAALGDLPCSVLATLEKDNDAVMNISTSAQLAFVMKPDFQPSHQSPEKQTVLYFPYFSGRYLAVAASLNGGNALATFVRTLQQWTLELGFSVPQSKVWEKILVLAAEENAVSSLKVIPTLLGERHSPEQNATVTNIDLGNLSLGQVFRALCSGVIENLHSMMPREVLLDSSIKRILGIGSALTRNKVLQAEVQHWYQLPIDFVSGGDAAMGAALSALSVS